MARKRLEGRASACHPERSEGSRARGHEILRCAQDDTGRTIRLSSPDEPMGQSVGINDTTLAPTGNNSPEGMESSQLSSLVVRDFVTRG